MKEKPVFPLLVSMALPMVISMLVNSLYNIVDSFFVAQISEDAMTALSLVYPVQNFVNAVAIGFGIGLNAVISYYLGAGDKKAAGCAATQGLALTMLHAVILTIGSLLVIERFLRMFSSSETVIDLGVRYSRIIFLFTIAIMANLYFEKVFQAVGRMKVTMTGMMIFIPVWDAVSSSSTPRVIPAANQRAKKRIYAFSSRSLICFLRLLIFCLTVNVFTVHRRYT